MKNNLRAFICPHIDDEYSLCQDRFYTDCERNFFAVSDGVSSSFSPTYYAELISSYQDSGTTSISKDDAKKIFEKWTAYIEGLLTSGKLGRASKQRYLRGEMPSATYARLKFSEVNGSFIWNGAVLGDCVIIHARRADNNISIAHAILSGEKFKHSSYMYSNEEDYYRFGKLPDQLDKDGTFLDAEAILTDMPLQEGDIFILCTDGMSDWILNDAVKARERLNKILALQNQEEFLSLVEKERTSDGGHGRNMENDDITLIIIEINDLRNDTLEYDNIYVADIKDLIEKENQERIPVLEPSKVELEESEVNKVKQESPISRTLVDIHEEIHEEPTPEPKVKKKE